MGFRCFDGRTSDALRLTSVSDIGQGFCAGKRVPVRRRSWILEGVSDSPGQENYGESFKEGRG